MLKPEDGNNFARDEQLRSDGCGKNLSKYHVQASSCPTGTPLPPTEVAPSATLPTECLLCLLLHSWYKSIHSVWNFLNRCVKCLWWLSVRGLIPQFKDQKMVQSWLPWGFFLCLGAMETVCRQMLARHYKHCLLFRCPRWRAVLALCGTRPSGSTEVFSDTHSPGDSLLFVTFSSDFLEALSTSIRENKRQEKEKVAFRIRQRKWPSFFFFQSCRYWQNSEAKH